MNWSLVRRCGLRYTLVYAGLTVVVVFALTRSPLVLIGLFGLGLASLVFALGGTKKIRMGTAVTNAQSIGLQSTIADPADDRPTALANDIKLLFYGVGLVVFATITLVATG
ncbi:MULTISPECIES: hypothetical protein [unclassified Haladaptatus]|uniref:hypothetical protein n=1 Tax=unclassified Haladaptatus TaxID=2622732 RepID=UPI00209C4A40|nr:MULTISPECIES: hypothetical protein [unclassified Haladaptatus]MCO8244480.1 hypothetical protein [Haladaptatus sp. AB643]MCO8253898.1 hypothetical protein [Haladaptatus sp. AB618]